MLTFEDSAKPVSRNLKIMLYGGPGTGKTMFGLGAPTPLIIDTESSTDAYRGRPDLPPFTVAKSASPKEIAPVLDELQGKGFIQTGGKQLRPETLIIDSFSVLWAVSQEAGQKRAEQRARTKGRPVDEESLAFGDWSLIKRPIQALSTRLINMPVHVVITAREKDLYDDNKSNPRKIGVVPDIERNIPYVFDLVLRLVVEGGQRVAIVEKSRFLDFPPGKRIENPSWSTFAHLAQSGLSAGLTPDLGLASDKEAEPEPAAWTRQPELVKKAETFRDVNSLTDSDLNAALDCEDWRQTSLGRDEFKQRVHAYVERKTGAPAEGGDDAR